MQKNNIRDYAISAFSYWSDLGCPTCEQAEEILSEDRAALEDVKACVQTFEELKKLSYGDLVCKAVETVYMPKIRNQWHRGDVTLRVRHFAYNTPMSEKQVYNYLKLARKTFAEKRGLRIGSDRSAKCL